MDIERLTAHGRSFAQRSAAFRYGSAVLCVGVATLASWALQARVGNLPFFPPFTGAVVFAAWLGGLGPGLLVTAAGAVINALRALPVGSLPVYDPATQLRILLFVLTGVFISVIIDSRNRAARLYVEQREWWRVGLSSIGDGVILTDEKGRIIFVNPVTETLTGWKAHEAIGHRLPEIFRIINEQSRQPVEDPVAKVLRDGVVVGLANHTLLVRRDGKESAIDDSAAPVRDEAGRLLGVVLVFRDVSDRRALEREAEARSQRLRLQAELIDHAYDAVFVRDESPAITYWNPACTELYGWTEQEALGQNPHDLLRTRFPVSLEVLDEALRKDGHWAGELVHTTREGREVVVDSRHVLVPGNGAEGARVLEINRDITERKRAEGALRRSEERLATLYQEAQEASRLKDEFLATLSHELRTPLNAIRGWSQMLLAGKLDASTVQRAYESIDRNAQAQTQLITDILDVSRIITGKLRLELGIVDVAEILEAVVDSMRPAADAKRLQLDTAFESRPLRLLADGERLQQVFWNLLSNAVKFTPSGGRVVVSAAPVDSRVQVRVTDSGVGIPPEFLPRVFDRFSQADASASRPYGGLGLGLAITRHLVELHGGTIRAGSAGEGQGAAFTVVLPVRAVDVAGVPATAPEPVGAAQSTPSVPSLDGVTVVVVDDEADARELLAVMLQQHGARVLTAASAAEGLVCIQQERPTVIVSDIGMPEVDGYGFMGMVRSLPSSQGGETPAVALTAYARAEDRLRALASGYQQHVAKPVVPSELLMVVGALAKRAGKGAAE